MVRHAEKWLRARGIKKALLMVRENNRRVRGFYERLGYLPEPRHIMSRALVPPAEAPPQQQHQHQHQHQQMQLMAKA